MRIVTSWVGAALMIVGICGCGESGPTRYRLSGAVLFDGKPLPAGRIVFTPDGSLKNSGPQGVAEIRDGRYDTGSSGGKGIAGGPTVIFVTGLEGPGKVLCEQELKAELPRSDSTYDINLSKPAGPPSTPVKEI